MVMVIPMALTSVHQPSSEAVSKRDNTHDHFHTLPLHFTILRRTCSILWRTIAGTRSRALPARFGGISCAKFAARIKAATKANGRQDEQDLQDGFCLSPAGDTFVSVNPVTSFILSALFILSKNKVSIR
jgi:hypothetical protein